MSITRKSGKTAISTKEDNTQLTGIGVDEVIHIDRVRNVETDCPSDIDWLLDLYCT